MKKFYEVLIPISRGYPSVKGRLHTRYAPVRRSPASIATPAAPRLACIKPAASVHPEPGSNSPSYLFFEFFESLFSAIVFTYYSYICYLAFYLNFNFFIQRTVPFFHPHFSFSQIGSAKVLLFLLLPNYFLTFFCLFFQHSVYKDFK